jgi:hypothetical protein
MLIFVTAGVGRLGPEDIAQWSHGLFELIRTWLGEGQLRNILELDAYPMLLKVFPLGSLRRGMLLPIQSKTALLRSLPTFHWTTAFEVKRRPLE